MRFCLLFIFSVYSLCSFSQVILEPSLYSNMGGSATFGTMQIDFSVGEPVIQTASANGVTLTQGFHQPIKRFGFTDNAFKATYFSENTCRNKQTGVIKINTTGGLAPYYAYWSDIVDDSTIFQREDLAAGTYVIFVTDSYLGSDSLTVVIEETDDCVRAYTGITPNGDGANDSWYIINIDAFPENEVQIYSRWGNMVWETQNYNNESNYWSGQSKSSDRLPDGTYFFVIQNAGPKPIKGWVELTGDN